MDRFEYNVPRFTSFNSSPGSDEEVEKYFDFDHESENQYVFGHKDDESQDSVEFETDDVSCKSDNDGRSSVYKTPRKSEVEILKGLSGLCLTTPNKTHPMETRLDSALKNPPLSLRSRNVPKVSFAPQKEIQKEDNRISGKRKGSEKSGLENPLKCFCLAEEVQKFHKVTPARFHTKSRHETFHNRKAAWRSKSTTIPISPHLNVLNRNRPNQVLSRKQLEDIEVEEMKKHQVKARPINDNILKPPSISRSNRSFRVTEFKPFNLTEFKKKVEEPRATVMKFTARPIPKGLFKKVDVKNTSAPTVMSHLLHAPRQIRVPVQKTKEKENEVVSKTPRKGPIVAAPFSFYDNDMARLKHKEEKIKKVLEEEKKQHQFYANPLPKFPEKPFQEKATIIPTIQIPFKLSADDKGKANKEKWEKKLIEENMQMKKAAEFKARPAVILNKKPFVPEKTDHIIKPLDVQLNTEIRARERNLFDLKMEMKQREIEEIKLQRKKELEKIEEEKLARLREETNFKANPIRTFEYVKINPASKLPTVPLSPKSFCNEHK